MTPDLPRVAHELQSSSPTPQDCAANLRTSRDSLDFVRGHARVPHVIVVGSGIAGLTAALHAVDGDCRVTVVTKDVLDHANTRFAQGGIAAVMFDDDRIEDHIRDTLVAGAGLCDPDAVHVLAEEGPARIRELVALGVAFDRDLDGAWLKGLEAAHSYPRILHAGGDATGVAIEHALVARLRASDVRLVEHAFLVDLVLEPAASAPQLHTSVPTPHDPAEILRTSRETVELTNAPRVTGVELLVGGGRRTLTADAVVLATGGAGELYARTTNPSVATGDGIAAALRAGAEVRDLEFVQFHPTVLATGEPFLVSEAVRGEGAVLRDEAGHRFMPDVHPDAELAPRDVVSRAVADVMRQQGGRPVVLDATRVHSTDAAERAVFLARRFPTIDAAVRARGLDWATEPIPVTPAAHYLMGGIVTDLHGRTSVRGLYAVGEVARTGVHGANRLASNSLLEGAVFGARAGDAVASDAASESWSPAFRLASGSLNDRSLPPRSLSERRGRETKRSQPFTRAALQQLMWAYAGVTRDAEGLERAAAQLAVWREQARAALSIYEHENENLLLVATELVAAALRRPASVGAHFRSDEGAFSAEVPEREMIAC